MMATYNFFIFTEFVDNLDTQYSIGWANIGIVTILVMINMGVIISSSFVAAKKSYILIKRKRENRTREQMYLEHLAEAEKKYQKQIDEALKQYNANKKNAIYQPRMVIHALLEKSMQDQVKQKKATSDLE